MVLINANTKSSRFKIEMWNIRLCSTAISACHNHVKGSKNIESSEKLLVNLLKTKPNMLSTFRELKKENIQDLDMFYSVGALVDPLCGYFAQGISMILVSLSKFFIKCHFKWLEMFHSTVDGKS